MKIGEATRFVKGEPRASLAGRKGRLASPWGSVPFNQNAKRTLRLEAIKRAAKATQGETL